MPGARRRGLSGNRLHLQLAVSEASTAGHVEKHGAHLQLWVIELCIGPRTSLLGRSLETTMMTGYRWALASRSIPSLKDLPWRTVL
jgi:hypothetical protein